MKRLWLGAAVLLFILGGVCRAGILVNQIAFTQRVGGVNYLYVMNPDGTNVRQLSSQVLDAGVLAWSPDGKHIAFGSGGLIYRINRDGTGLFQYPTGGGCPSQSDTAPDWSIDGAKIIFTANETNGSAVWSLICTMSSVDGSSRTKVLGNDNNGTGIGGVANGTAQFTLAHYDPANSSLLALASTYQQGGNFAVFIYNLNTQAFVKISQIVGVSFMPLWSPNGAQIAFQCATASDGNVNVCTMDADGSNTHKLTNLTEPLESAYVSWAPDGSRLAFSLDDCTGLSNCTSQTNPAAPASIWIVNPDGTGGRNTGQACAAIGCSPVFDPASGGGRLSQGTW
jgi:Tol biopolymer transport system component